MRRDFGKLNGGAITYAPNAINNDFNAPASAYIAAGWLPVITDNQPTATGVTYSPSGWEQRDGAIYRTWEATPIVAPVKVYKVEEVIYGLIQKNALQAVKQIVGDYWELFTMRDTISADNEIFVAQWPTLKAAIIAAGALTEAEIDEILEETEVA